MDCEELIDEMLSCFGEQQQLLRNDKVTAGDHFASPATPDACSGEQQRYEVTGQSRQKPGAPNRVQKYRLRLASVAAGGQAGRYGLLAHGKALIASHIEELADSEIKRLYARYEARLGAAISMFLPIPAKNQQRLIADLEGYPFCGVMFRSFNLGGESLKVGIDYERSRQLLVVVLEGELVFPLFRHLHPHGCLAYPTAPGSVGFQQTLPCVAVQAALAKVLALSVLALIVEKAIKVLDPGEVMLTGFSISSKFMRGIPSDWVLSLLTVTPLSQPNTLMARLFRFSILGI